MTRKGALTTAQLTLVLCVISALGPLTASATSLAFSQDRHTFFEGDPIEEFSIRLSHLDEESGSFRITMFGKAVTTMQFHSNDSGVRYVDFKHQSAFTTTIYKLGQLPDTQIELLRPARSPLVTEYDDFRMTVRVSKPLHFLRPKRFIASWQVTLGALPGDYVMDGLGGPITCRVFDKLPWSNFCAGEGASDDPFYFSIFDTELSEASSAGLQDGRGSVVIPVPEPSAALLLGAGLLVLGVWREQG